MDFAFFVTEADFVMQENGINIVANTKVGG